MLSTAWSNKQLLSVYSLILLLLKLYLLLHTEVGGNLGMKVGFILFRKGGRGIVILNSKTWGGCQLCKTSSLAH